MGRHKTPPGERKPADHFERELNQGLVAELTPQIAMVYAKLLTAGCPPVRGVYYCIPSLTTDKKGIETAKHIARTWMHDERVLGALNNINGGEWHTLPPERRAQLALDKHNAEWSFYLWTTNVNDIESREGLEKLKQAREVIKGVLGQQPDEADPMQAFARFAIELAKNAAKDRAVRGKTMPQLSPKSLEAALNEPVM